MSSNERLSKLPPPPPPSSFTSIQRKSFMKISSTNGIPNSKKIEDETVTSHNVRRVPVIRSISTTPEVQRPMSPMFGSPNGSQNHHGSLDRLDNFSSIDLPSSLRIASRLSHKSGMDPWNSSSSGYDSNSSSSLSYFNGPNTNRRFAPATEGHRYYSLSGGTESSDTASEKSQDTVSHARSLLSSPRNKRHSFNEKCIKDEVVRTLDRLEKRIAFFREVAVELSEERHKLLDALSQVNTCCSLNTFTEVDLQDIQASVKCLQHRLGCVDIAITTIRSQGQVEALKKANQCLDDLNQIVNKGGKMAAKQRCLSYISSCSSDNLTDDENRQMVVPIDERFQKTVIQCSLEDQKSIRKKLQALLLNIEK